MTKLKQPSRREFVQQTAAAGAALALSGYGTALAGAAAARRSTRRGS